MTHVKSDLNENWSRTDNDRDNGTQDKSSGSGCYLTTTCMNHMQDNFVNKDDIKHYYNVAPIIVAKINSIPENKKIYKWIYEQVVQPCVVAIQNKNYEFAYNRYKSSVLALEEQFINCELEINNSKILKRTK